MLGSRSFPLLLLLGAILCTTPQNALGTPSPEASMLDRPLVHTTGLKIVMHSNNNQEKDGINRGLYYVRYIIEHYQRLGISPDKLKVVAVFYGDGVNLLLNDETMQKRAPKRFKPNPNAAMVKELLDLGVSLEACGETMRLRKLGKETLLPGVAMAPGGYVRVIDLQLSGYAYIRV